MEKQLVVLSFQLVVLHLVFMKEFETSLTLLSNQFNRDDFRDMVAKQCEGVTTIDKWKEIFCST